MHVGGADRCHHTTSKKLDGKYFCIIRDLINFCYKHSKLRGGFAESGLIRRVRPRLPIMRLLTAIFKLS